MNLRDRYTHHTQSAYSLKLYLPEHSHKEPQNSVLTAASNETFTQADTITAESYRVADVAHNAKSIIENLDREFEAQTKLHGKDIGFLFFATSLQCVRQYFLTDFKTRLGNQDAAKNTKGHIEEHSDRHHRLYNPSVEQIKHNPVPFDTTFGGPEMAEQITTDSGKVVSVSPFMVYDKNFQKMDGNTLKHHTTTLGHDPILGWIFGSAEDHEALYNDLEERAECGDDAANNGNVEAIQVFLTLSLLSSSK